MLHVILLLMTAIFENSLIIKDILLSFVKQTFHAIIGIEQIYKIFLKLFKQINQFFKIKILYINTGNKLGII
ncbi:TPA: hypothetical protein CPT80_07705 [Candidatus Gastranaerophilales bacterium HUM_9]|nr:MAG TPA: hypothetical protein CPT80_07705 [Candidatus Gastranaerophilales bacterium HUM_9]HBX35124.1 hypothetical protein [Cyanobacteria bacterium UBA11440]